MALHLTINQQRVSFFFYQLFLVLYQAGIRIISPWNPKARRWLAGRKDQWPQLESAIRKKQPASENSQQTLWMHCASLGEFEQGRPVLENIKTRYPDLRVVITFFSPSGYEIRKNYSGADHVFYLPMDSRPHAKRFISLVKPTLVLWIKYDYWFFYLDELNTRKIPVLLISAVFRTGQPFFRWYGKLHRHMLHCFTQLFVQNEESASLLAGIGIAENVAISGDTRFDRVIEIANRSEPIPSIEKFCGNFPVIVAGSTWEEDEEELDHFANTHPELRFILAPHEIDADHLRDIRRLFKHAVLYSAWEQHQQLSPFENPPNTLIIDNIGMLAKLYRYATIAYVGGGFGDDGVHNVLEPAVYGKPVVFGPVIEKFAEAVDLVECGGGIVVDSALEVESQFNRLLKNENERTETGKAASDYVQTKKGATAKIVQYIQENRLLTTW